MRDLRTLTFTRVAAFTHFVPSAQELYHLVITPDTEGVFVSATSNRNFYVDGMQPTASSIDLGQLENVWEEKLSASSSSSLSTFVQADARSAHVNVASLWYAIVSVMRKGKLGNGSQIVKITLDPIAGYPRAKQKVGGKWEDMAWGSVKETYLESMAVWDGVESWMPTVAELLTLVEN